MPMGAFVADKKIMDSFTHDPVLGHINTFGGHPVCCAAGLAAFKVLLEENLISGVKEKEELFLSLLKQTGCPVRSRGLMIALEFKSFEMNKNVIDELLKPSNSSNGLVFTDWFLFAPNCLRIAPALTITPEEISQACNRILEVVAAL